MVNQSIKSKRERLGITQKEFADALGLGRNGDRTLRRWENGESEPSALELKVILNFPEDPPFPSPNINKFTMIDLFAGIGGRRLAFQNQGGLSVFSSELDKFAAKTYRLNYGELPIGDITKVHETHIPDHNILLGYLPYQSISNIESEKCIEGTKGTLFFEVARILKEKKPQAFFLESEKKLESLNKGQTLETLLKILKEKLDYSVEYEVLCSSDFGVPQNRDHLYIVGFHNSFGGNLIPFSFPKPIPKPTRVGDVLEEFTNEKYTISDKLHEKLLRKKRKHYKKENSYVFSVFHKDDIYTNSISKRYYKDASEILIDQGPNKKPRKLTPRECARLQGFPEEFIIPISDTQAFRQFGMSVTIPVAEAIAKNMVTAIEKSVGFQYKTNI